MGRITRNLRSVSGMLLMLLGLLILLFFLLNQAAQRGWGPISSIANWAESHANGSAYGAAPAVAGVPSTPAGGGFGIY